MKRDVHNGCKCHKLYATLIMLLQGVFTLPSMTRHKEFGLGIFKVQWDQHSARKKTFFFSCLCLPLFFSHVYSWGFVSIKRPSGESWGRSVWSEAQSCPAATRKKPLGDFPTAPQQSSAHSCLALKQSYPWRYIHFQDTLLLFPITFS